MRSDRPLLLISNKKGRITPVEGLEAAGMEAGYPFRLAPGQLIKLPPNSQVFMLPQRIPVGYDAAAKRFAEIKNGHFAVAAFTPPAYTITHTAAYIEEGSPKMLPLFAYGAVASFRGEFYAAAVRVDPEARHDARFIDMALVRKNIKKFRKIFPQNRLVRHLEKCALIYGCPGGQNFFLSRYEGPLPTSPRCNARCFGCISYQYGKACTATQPRISFVPTPEEVAEVALFHIENVKDPVLSFGQGCEGEPLMNADILERSIRLIRAETTKGMINVNTNASKPEALKKLFDAGLDSMRVSLNSAREKYYTPYYKPKDYSFADVVRSIKIAKGMEKFVSINYLTMPGFTDSKDEFSALKKFIESNHVDMIQWRNLNFDPAFYLRELKVAVGRDDVIGLIEMMRSLKKYFPNLMMGYFNPSRQRIARRI